MKNRVVLYFVIFIGIILSMLVRCKKELPKEIPSLVTINVTDISSTSFTTGGLIFSGGGSLIVSRGICLSTVQNPKITDIKTIDGAGTGSFTSIILGLQAGTTYYLRAYATNSVGTGYGNQYMVTTTVTAPTLTTKPISSVTSTMATSGGIITLDGGAKVTARGICWSTSSGALITGNHTTDGDGAGNFSSSITGLIAGTTYYIRAYATNSAGTSYGNELTFTILTLPALTTLDIACNTISSISASGGGDVTSDGGAAVTAKGICWSTATGPTISNNKTTDGTGTGSFTSLISGLRSETTYYLRAYATNSVGTEYGNETSFTTLASFQTCGTITDIDGNVYNTVKIGTQCWMAENLKTTKFRNGDPIPYVSDGPAWQTLTSGAYCWYYNDLGYYKDTFGAIYNWNAVVDSRNIAPVGWHIPTDAEWKTLTDFLGGGGVAGGKLKGTCTNLWIDPNVGATNASGFTALPGGYRDLYGTYNYNGYYGFWWSSTNRDAITSWCSFIENSSTFIARDKADIKSGLSVRCVHD